MNESIVAIPPNVEEPQVLTRFLQRLVEELDLVLGFRGDDALVKQSQLTSAASDVAATAATTLSGVALALEELTEVVSTLEVAAEESVTDIDEELVAIKTRLDDLEVWQASATLELADHEARITALENA